MVANSQYWKPLNSEEGYFTLALRPGVPITSRLHHMKACGMLCLLHMFVLRSGPDPVSPFLLEFAINGLRSIMDHEFIATLAPETATRLKAWPMNPDVPFPVAMSHNLRYIISEYLGLNVSASHCMSYVLLIFICQPVELDVGSMLPEERESLPPLLYAGALILLRADQSYATHPELHAFAEGFNIILNPDTHVSSFGVCSVLIAHYHS